jgi:alpha-mannosidase
MLKHTQLTHRRIQQFLQSLQPKIFGPRFPLAIEFCDAPHPDQRAAQAGVWRPVEPGHRYGPAYKTFWFRLKGSIPTELEGKEAVVFPEVGGERTVWVDGSPVAGVDEFHSWYTVSTNARAGEPIELYVQAYTRNPQCRVAGREEPREKLVETVQACTVTSIDRELQALLFDLEFSENLLSALDEHDPSHATILRALNDVCNLEAAGHPDWVARGRRLVRDALGSISCELKHTVTAVGHAHLDTAWLWPLDITMKKMAHTTASQLALMDRYPEYVFAHSQASQYEWLETQYPVLFERVKEKIRSGQWEPVGSMWVEADCNLPGGESLVRQFLYGRRYFREKLGYETHDMWLPDVFGYSAALPQILAKFGIKTFVTQKISWNQTNKFPHHTFWWEGIDGTRVWTHFPPADTYCGDCTPKQLLQGVRNYADHGRCDHSLYLFGWGDGGGGPTEKHLEYLRRARVAPVLPEIQSRRRALDFFREAQSKSKDLMVWVGELYLELHRGTYTSQAATKKGNRMGEFALRDAEWLAAFDPENRYPAEELERLWKLLLLNQFHDIIPGSSVREVYEDAARDYAEIQQGASRIIEASLRAIGGRLDTSGFHRPVALFHNAGIVSQAAIPWGDEPAPQSVVCGGERLPVQLVDDLGETKLLFPTPEAALGTVAVADLSPEPPKTKFRLKGSSRRIENGEWSVRFDANGNILSIEDLEDRTEFVEPGKLANVFQLLDDRPLFWSAWDVDVYSFETAQDLLKCESFEIVERGPVRVAAKIVRRFGESTITQLVSLGPTPGVRFDTLVDWREENKMLKVAFPVNVHSNRATYEIQFGNVERPTHANTSWDQARFEVCAQKWVDVSEGDLGVALLNDCKYGHDVRGNTIRLSLLRSPKAPDPQCDMGLHRFTYVLLPHVGPVQYSEVVEAAYALNAPLRWTWLDAKPGVQGQLDPLVQSDSRHLMIEAVKRAEDGRGLIVRLYECHHTRGEANVSCLLPVKEAHLCDLEERTIEELEVEDGAARVQYRPFEILTLRLIV